MRITVRRAVRRTADGSLQFADVVGDLLGVDDAIAVIEARSGRVEVPLGHVVAARVVPASTADELALEAAAAAALRPAETQQLGGWRLRADGGFTRRANSVLPLGQPGRPVAEALDRAHEWYAARTLPLLVQLPVEARRLLDAELGERGWPAEARTHLMTARLDRVHAAEAAPGAVSLAAEPADAWLATYRGGGGLTATGRALLTRHDTVAFASIEQDGAAAAVARGAVDGEWLSVMAVEVAPEHRRRGLASALMSALWQWGRERGAARSHIQVLTENAPAVALYQRLGYRVHHDYHYRREP